MTLLHDGNGSKRNTGSAKRIITRSFRTKMELVTFAYALLSRYEDDNTLQLTIVMRPGKYEASFVTTATTGSSRPFGKAPPLLAG